jgi:hypothetical protein
MAGTVFISHAHADHEVAQRICQSLEEAGFGCWIAIRDISPGAIWAEAISNAIDRSGIMIVLFSAESNLSQQVLREVELGIRKELIIVPFRIEDIRPTGSLEYYMSACHWLDATTPPLEKHLTRLIETLQALDSKARRKVDEVGGKAIVRAPHSAGEPARLVQQWQLRRILSRKTYRPLPAVLCIWQSREHVLCYHRGDAVQAVSVLGANDGECLWDQRVPLDSGLAHIALHGSHVFLCGSSELEGNEQVWVTQIDISDGAVVLHERAVGTEIPYFELLGMTRRAYYDLFWQSVDGSTSVKDAGVHLQGHDLCVSTSRHSAEWRSPTGKLTAASSFLFNRIIIATSDARVYCLCLKAGQGRPPGTSGGQWYAVLHATSDRREMRVRCENCGYTELYRPALGDRPPLTCPCCGF